MFDQTTFFGSFTTSFSQPMSRGGGGLQDSFIFNDTIEGRRALDPPSRGSGTLDFGVSLDKPDVFFEYVSLRER